jgi:hypothetical protein
VPNIPLAHVQEGSVAGPYTTADAITALRDMGADAGSVA